MRRTRRHLFTLCSVISLLLCVAVCVLWVRSYAVVDGVGHARERRQSSVYSMQGRLIFETMGDSDVPVWPGFKGWELTSNSDLRGPVFIDVPQVRARGMLGFKRARITNNMGGGVVREISAVAMPNWFFVVLSLVFPLAWLAAFALRRHRRRQAPCPSCGYDLCANRERCPECGALVE